MLAKDNNAHEVTPLLTNGHDLKHDHDHDHDHGQHTHEHTHDHHDHNHLHVQNKPNTDTQALQAKWVRIVTFFLYLTVVWAATEGGISVYGGWVHNHLSLFAFGVDSCIEVLSASLVLYHMMCKPGPMYPSSSNRSASPLTPAGHGSGATYKSVIF
eukprot:347634_1